MLKLLTGLDCYTPSHLGKKDILLGCDKILRICDIGELRDNKIIKNVISCEGLLAFPGMIDQHVHIIGGGGEEGAISRISEIDFEQIIKAGVSTLVGVLGFDSITRSLTDLLAKARKLELQGVTTYIYTGSYAIPTVTITNNIASDLVLIDKVIGTGEIAISDHRASQPSLQDFMTLSAQTHIGGLIGRKAGVVHIHLGDGKNGLKMLIDTIEKTELPIDQFIPTHVNRNEKLFQQSIEYCKNGGYIDLTAGETDGISVPDAISRLINAGVSIDRVTVSSDANASSPNGNVSNIKSLYDDIINIIKVKNVAPDIAFRFVSENVAKVLKIYPQKGTITVGSDADLLITDQNYNAVKLFCKGKMLMDNGVLV